MEKHLTDLIEISNYYGNKKDYVIAGGGNTSYKNEHDIWIKASGISLQGITEAGFAKLSREALQKMYNKNYSSDVVTREAEVKSDLNAACYSSSVRPSVETSLHELINYSFVVHTHPTLVNAVLCSNKAAETIKKLFSDFLFVPYTDPGYILFSKIKDLLAEWRKTNSHDPKLIFLQNHGVFVSANSIEEIKSIYSNIETVIKKSVKNYPETKDLDIPDVIVNILPALRMLMSEDNVKVARIRNNSLIQHFISGEKNMTGISLPFTPDQIVYCRARLVYLEQNTPESIINEYTDKIQSYKKSYGYMPKIVALKGYGIMAFDDNICSVENLLDVFDDWMKISYMSENFGGPHFMENEDIQFIENWEVENYRRSVAKKNTQEGKVENRVAIITGSAQGIGNGIAENLLNEGANVVIADFNEEKGIKAVNDFNMVQRKNKAIFIKTDVTDSKSVTGLIATTVKNFGGLDLFISNAGILFAGSLEEMTMETFERVTKVNYSAYFLCTKYASAILKLQSKYRNDYFTDIIQINSKSGLKGSNKNFAYAGGKFGGIGLTQSFALELMPFRIKVNSICPGNFFELPLWSDPENGLFVQYLRTGKVPGAKNIDDVKKYYERQAPAGRGCQIKDLMKAIYYVIDQEYETGQAIPVTGGQEMLR